MRQSVADKAAIAQAMVAVKAWFDQITRQTGNQALITPALTLGLKAPLC
jgi:hypothetical protein